MSEQIPTPEAATVEEPKIETQPETVDVEKLIADRDKWKSFARKHEDAWKTSTQELDALRKANLPDAERAIAEAKEKARSETLAEIGSRLATAELRAAAAWAGVEIPETVSQYLDASRFIGENGDPDAQAISAFVASLQPTGPKFPQNVGIGPQGSGAGISQLTREDLARMTPDQINAAREDGRLNSLLYGEP
ncbi:hypothetical protein [Nonomuraea sp. NPDC049141]|uniref:hypothetical protein n=1 Tax=Nonomuraea sp. NPDC049141 TaxID=3155500 RepID=UPI0033FA2CB3